jgi:hypothetical protein
MFGLDGGRVFKYCRIINNVLNLGHFLLDISPSGASTAYVDLASSIKAHISSRAAVISSWCWDEDWKRASIFIHCVPPAQWCSVGGVFFVATKHRSNLIRSCFPRHVTRQL